MPKEAKQLIELLTGLKEVAERVVSVSERSVEKSVKVKPSWKKMIDEMEALRLEVIETKEKVDNLVDRLQNRKKIFWATIESDLGLYDRDMRLTDDYKKIEILEEHRCDDECEE